MIKHILLFRFTDESTDEQRQSLLDELATFPARFPAMRSWTMGENRSSRDDRFSHGFVVEFETEEQLVEYLATEAHERFVRERFKPIIQERAIFSYVFSPTSDT